VALEAALETALAASVVVEAWRTAMRPIWGVRRSIREAEKDMMKTMRSDKGTTSGKKGVRVRGLLVRTAQDALAARGCKSTSIRRLGIILSVRLRAACSLLSSLQPQLHLLPPCLYCASDNLFFLVTLPQSTTFRICFFVVT
jgi:hypothetical protein